MALSSCPPYLRLACMLRPSEGRRCLKIHAGRVIAEGSKMGSPTASAVRQPVEIGGRQFMVKGRTIARCVLVLSAVMLLGARGAGAAPEGTLTFAMHFSPVPRWLDPAEGESTITPFLLLYALHDGLLKPMPGTGSAPSLAESWSMGKDGLSADFTLRAGIKFHNGDPVTAEDVKFSFERYRGGGAKVLKDTVKEIQLLGPT